MRVQSYNTLLDYETYVTTLNSKTMNPAHKVKKVYSPKKDYKTGQMFNFTV